MLKFSTANIIGFTAGFCKRLHLDSLTYLRATVAWPLRIHQTISENHRESTSDVFHSAKLILSCAIRFKWPVGTSDCDSLCFLLVIRWIRGGHAKIVRCFIRGEEFQRVGRTIFIKSKMLLFHYKLIISTRIFKILTFFYQVLIPIRPKHSAFDYLDSHKSMRENNSL
jgi:hypothetical protein